MDSSFWESRWQEGRIGFHQPRVHPTLRDIASARPFFPGTVFVPLAGKSVDLPWLAQKGARVIAVEWVRDAVESLFRENEIDFEQREEGKLRVYRAKDLDLTFYQGDLFDLRAEHVRDVTWTHDRASVVALPEETRTRYGAHLSSILPARATLVVTTFEYKQDEMAGPPFSVPQTELERVFSDYRIEHIRGASVLEDSPLLRERGVTRIEEHVFLGHRR